MTGEEAAAALKAGVEALFAEARGGELNERCAYIRVGKEQTPYAYVTFSNGYKKEEGQPHPGPFVAMALPEMIDRTIAAVAAEFPDHATQCCLWRCEPEYEWRAAQKASKLTGEPAFPAHHTLYCRVVAVPIGAHGNCRFCGILHAESEPHWLTEQAMEELTFQVMREVRKEFVTKQEVKDGFLLGGKERAR